MSNRFFATIFCLKVFMLRYTEIKFEKNDSSTKKTKIYI